MTVETPIKRFLESSAYTGDQNTTANWLYQHGIRWDELYYNNNLFANSVPQQHWDAKARAYLRPGTQDAQFFGERSIHNLLEIGQNDVVLDVGGNVGLYSQYCLDRRAAVVAVAEPAPDNFEYLKANLWARCSEAYPAADLQKNIVVINGAIVPNACEARWINFYLNENGSNKGIHSMISRRGRKTISVSAVRWGDVIAAINPTIIKVDIEGGEYALITELSSLPARVRGIYCEMHLTKREWRAEYAPALYYWFQQQGFRTVKVPDVKPESKRWDTCYVGVR